MRTHDRLDMLKNISLFDKYDNDSIFKSYIPNYYNEVYSLYTLLEKIDVNYSDLDFYEPEESDVFTIKFKCQSDDTEKIKKFFKENKTNVFSFIRNEPLEIKVANNKNKISFIFKKC